MNDSDILKPGQNLGQNEEHSGEPQGRNQPSFANQRDPDGNNPEGIVHQEHLQRQKQTQRPQNEDEVLTD